MSATSAQSGDEYEEVTSDGQVNTATDNIVNDTQLMDSFETEMTNEQTNNLTNSEDGEVNTDKLQSRVIIETVQYEDYIHQKDGEIMKIELKREDGENIEVIELDDDEDEEDSVPPVKRFKPSLSIPSSSTKKKQVITLSLQCPQMDCAKMCTADQFNVHMLEKHSIRAFRCAVKDCKESFDSPRTLGLHRTRSHPLTTHWYCEKCDQHFAEYQLLSNHKRVYHQLGHFQCAFPSCPFKRECKRKVYGHYAQVHKHRL